MTSRFRMMDVILAGVAVLGLTAIGSTMLTAVSGGNEQAQCAVNLARFGLASAHYETVFNSFAPCDPWPVMPGCADDTNTDCRFDANAEQFDPAHSWLAFYGLGLRPNIPADHDRAAWNNHPFGFSVHAKIWPDEVWPGFLCPSQNLVNTTSYLSTEIDFTSGAKQPLLGVLRPQASGYMVNRLLRSAVRGRRLPRLPNAVSGGTIIPDLDNSYSTPALVGLSDSVIGGSNGGTYYIQAVNSGEVLKPGEVAYMADSLDYMIGSGTDETVGMLGYVERSAGTYHAMSYTQATVLGARHNGKANVLYVDGHVGDENQTPRNRRGDLITASTFADYVEDGLGFGNQHHVAPAGRHYDASPDSSGGFAPGDDEAPTVVATSPVNGGSVNSAHADTVTVSFSEQVRINETNVSVDSGAVVPATVEYRTVDARVTLTFDPPLSTDLHIVTVSAAVTDVMGNQLDGNGDGSGGDDTIFAFMVTDGTTAVSPGDGLQAAIDAAVDGDVLILQPGSYTAAGPIDLRGKAITLRSSDPADRAVVAATLVEASGGIVCASGETNDTVLDGLTIQNANAPGVSILGAAPVIRRCRVVNNAEGGIACTDGAPLIEACIIAGNTADYGAAIALYGSAALVRNNVIKANHATEEGGAVYSVMAVDDEILNNTMLSNTADGGGLGGATALCISGDVAVCNNIIVATGGESVRALDARPVVAFNLFDTIPTAYTDPIYHNLAGDPGIESVVDGIPRIGYGSICVNAGNYAWGLLHGETDIDGDVRSALGGVDIGADEIAEPEVLTVDDDGPADFGTIQAAIDAARGYQEIILVSPGTYPEQINFLGKAVTVTGTDPDNPATVAATIIDGQAGGDVVTFNSGEFRTSVLRGVTVTHSQPNTASGIACAGSPMIQQCVISHNSNSGIRVTSGGPRIDANTITQNTALRGGGVFTVGTGASHAEIVGNRIEANHADEDGGGICMDDAEQVYITHNVITGNTATVNGGGVHVEHGSDRLASYFTFVDNLLVGNEAEYVAGLSSTYFLDANQIRNCTFADNTGIKAVGQYSRLAIRTLAMRNCIVFNPACSSTLRPPNVSLVEYCLIRGWFSADEHLPGDETQGPGTIDGDPRFVDPANGDYRLAPDSPCINRGDPSYIGVWPDGEVDLDGNVRFNDRRIDIGCYEAAPRGFVLCEPLVDSTFAKAANNVLRITLTEPVALPSGAALQIVPLAGGADVGDQFAYAVEPDGVTLKATENGAVLAEQTWYRVTPAVGLTTEPFAVNICKLVGDADGNGQVLASDLAQIWVHNGEFSDARYDINGDGQVLARDLGVAWAANGHEAPPKP